MYGYIKIGAAVPKVKVANCSYNASQILECIGNAARENIRMLVFPELSVCGYTCGDLFFQAKLISECEKTVGLIAEMSADFDIVSVIGTPIMINGCLYNCAVALHGGRILGAVPKQVLAEGGQFYEKRWFKSGMLCHESSISYCGSDVPFGFFIFKCENYQNFNFAIEVCADLWSVYPPSGVYSQLGATVVANVSASPNYAGKPALRAELAKIHSRKCNFAYIYCACSVGESSSDSVYDGHAIITEQGEITAESRRYSTENEITVAEADVESAVLSRAKDSRFAEMRPTFDVRTINFSFMKADVTEPQITMPRSPFVPENNAEEFYEEIFNIQTFGLYKRLCHTGIKKTVIGVSGGLDSTLALLVAVNCHDKLGLPRETVLGITMPGFGTSGRTHRNAISLMKALNISTREISIKEACIQHFKDIGHSAEETGVAFENAQARERTQILMDIANMESGLVLGTGDMSELALGWATYNGDHMSMYNVNASVPKTVMRGLIAWLAKSIAFGGDVGALLTDILYTPVSPELLPSGGDEISQKTEDIVGPYELHDFFIYYAVHKGFSPVKTAFLAKRSFEGIYDEKTVQKWLSVFYKRFFSQQFKRSCSPDSPKTLEFNISQRADLKIPSDVDGSLWTQMGYE